MKEKTQHIKEDMKTLELIKKKIELDKENKEVTKEFLMKKLAAKFGDMAREANQERQEKKQKMQS